MASELQSTLYLGSGTPFQMFFDAMPSTSNSVASPRKATRYVRELALQVHNAVPTKAEPAGLDGDAHL